MMCEYEVLIGTPGKGGGFIKCGRETSWTVAYKNGRTDVPICTPHKASMTRRARRYDQPEPIFRKATT